jgi:hypothetical protein
MPSAGFEPKIPASEWPKTLALDRAETGVGLINFYRAKCSVILHDFRGCYLSVKEGINYTTVWLEVLHGRDNCVDISVDWIETL